MAKKTLLKMVQFISGRIGGDEIDELDETIEASEIMDIIELTYDEVLDRKTWEFMKDRTLRMKARDVLDTKLFDLPIPSMVTRVKSIKYTNNQGDKVHLEYVEPMLFIDRLDSRDEGLTEITEIANDDGVLLKIYTDRAPTFYTSFDEAVLSFDAYDSTRGTGNQAGDTVILADVKPVVDFTDPTATLPIPERMGTLVLNEAMATAAFQLRQVQDSRAERIARRQGIHLRETEPTTKHNERLHHHGRKTSSGR